MNPAKALLQLVLSILIGTSAISSSSAQSRSETAAQLSALVNASSYSDELQYYNNSMNTSASDLTHSYDSFQSISFTRTEKYARVSSSYSSIPWRNLAFITREKIRNSTVYLFFSEPVLQQRKYDYGPYFKGKQTDQSGQRTVKSICLHIRDKDLLLFEALCFRMKQMDSTEPQKKSLPALTLLPSASNCPQLPPPTSEQAKSVLFNATTGYTIEPSEWKTYWYRLMKLGEIDISKMDSDTLKVKAPKMQQYWNAYGYNFSTENSQQIMGGSITTLLELNKDHFQDDAWYLIVWLMKGNGNILNPYNGKNYLDNLATDQAKEEHSSDFEPEKAKEKWMTFERRTLPRYGLKPSSAMLELYRSDPDQRQALVEAIVCNTRGEAVLAGLKDDPERFLLRVYHMGLRNFPDAVFLYEKIHGRTLSQTDKTRFQNKLGSFAVLWD